MLHVRKTYAHGAFCHYLVRSYTLNGQPRQHVLFCLGEHNTIEEAIDYWRAQETETTSEARRKYAAETIRKLSYYLSLGANPNRFTES